MFRRTDAQGRLFSTLNLLTSQQEARLGKSWAPAFHDDALPLINENDFAELYHRSHGAPNKSVRMLVGMLILKEMFDLTDEETLDALHFDLRWHVALGLDASEAHCCQKTLHSFRLKLIESEKGPQLFEDLTGKIIAALGLDTSKQRMDSTHICSNLATLSRLGICCETMRVFLRKLKKEAPDDFEKVPVSLRRRYLKEDGVATGYDDGNREQSRRRLPVAARDLYRLTELFRGDETIGKWESYQLLVRALEEQCEVVARPQEPKADDDDAGEAPIPVKPRDPKNLRSNAMPSPHDPDPTFGKKGVGHELQLAETFGNKSPQDPEMPEAEKAPEKPEIITYVKLSESCGSDVNETIPALEDLARRNLQPGELETDANFTSSEVIRQAREMGTEVNGPVKGGEKHLPGPDDVTVGDFHFDLEDARNTRCPEGQSPLEQVYDPETGKLKVFFRSEDCADCPSLERCPAKDIKKPKARVGQRAVTTDHNEVILEQRRRYQTTEAFRKRQAPRAGIEATNSEYKRGHGGGHLRVRRRKRVELAVFLKVLACNLKRFVRYQVARLQAACRAGMPAPAVCEG